jgi:uncharacterized protein with ParB-like and HNH nuclease domain
MSITASEKKIYEIFSPRHFQFVVPAYQRPYAWGQEQALALVQDLIDAFDSCADEEYFLGSIVVVRNNASTAEVEVVDGQQRLTSLSLLMAAIRDLLPAGQGSDITRLLVDDFRNNRVLGLRLRTSGKYSDEHFFDHYIRSEVGFCELKGIKAVLSSSQQCLFKNALVIREELERRLTGRSKSVDNKTDLFLDFVLNKTCLVVIESDDFDSAYRIFSTMNNRGLPLGVSDLIKALILEQFKDEEDREYVNRIWEEEEADLTRISGSENAIEGRRYFELLFTHMHRITSKRRTSKNLFDDFKKDVLGLSGQKKAIGASEAKNFVENFLVGCSDAYELILKHRVPIPDAYDSRKVNQLFLPLLANIPNSDWQPVAISYLRNYSHQMGSAYRFFELLERTAAISLILGENINRRARRYAPILHALDSSLSDAIEALTISVLDDEKASVIANLNSRNLYRESFSFYAMLRLDSALAEDGISPSLSAPRASIEHVLPQTLDGDWINDWDMETHSKYVNQIGNLVLLSKRKNSRAQNFNFEAKKSAYFAAKGGAAGEVVTFPSVTRVLQIGDRWTPTIVSKNQDEFITLLSKTWSL